MDNRTHNANRLLSSNRFGDRARGSRHERGYGTAWEKTRKVIFARDCGLCQPCRRTGILHEANEVDHIVPKYEGGTDDHANLQAINAECHAAKTAAEAQRARGCALKPRPACDATGLPTDRSHPWWGGGENSTLSPPGPIPELRLQSGEMEGGGYGG